MANELFSVCFEFKVLIDIWNHLTIYKLLLRTKIPTFFPGKVWCIYRYIYIHTHICVCVCMYIFVAVQCLLWNHDRYEALLLQTIGLVFPFSTTFKEEWQVWCTALVLGFCVNAGVLVKDVLKPVEADALWERSNVWTCQINAWREMSWDGC